MPATDPAWDLSPQEIQQLESEKPVIQAESVANSHIKEIHAYIWVKAPPQYIFNTITDYKKLPEFMPHLDAIKILQHDAAGAQVNYYLGLPFGVEKRYRLQLTYAQDPVLEMAWQSIPWQGLEEDETIKDSKGYWRLNPIEHQQQTLIVYYTKTDPGHVPFGLGWIVKYLTEKTVVDLLTVVKDRAEQAWQNTVSQ